MEYIFVAAVLLVFALCIGFMKECEKWTFVPCETAENAKIYEKQLKDEGYETNLYTGKHTGVEYRRKKSENKKKR